MSDGGVNLTPAEGAALGGIRYRERVRPLVRIVDLLRTLERDARFVVTARSAPQRLTTAEGEYAALITIDGEIDDVPAQRCMGFVFGDDYYAHIAGLCLQAPHFGRFADAVQRLTLQDAHMLGVRRRRYLYDPPTGWNGLLRLPLVAHYYPIDYPRNGSLMVVCPAIPRSRWDREEALSSYQPVEDRRILEQIGSFLISTARLSGELFALAMQHGEEQLFRDLAVLFDEQYAYPVLLDSPPERRDANRQVLRVLLESIEPLPQVGAQEKPALAASEALGHWL